jgi:hypothetical protein
VTARAVSREGSLTAAQGEETNGCMLGASSVLQIGGDTGALLVHAPQSRLGAEIEIRGIEDAWEGTHTAVRERIVGQDRHLYSGLFPALSSGVYEIRWREPDGPVEDRSCTNQTIIVAGGVVTETMLPDAR